MNEYEIDPNQWFGKRELEFMPKHFYVTKTPLTDESKFWVIHKLKGRYALVSSDDEFDFMAFNVFPAFEDNAEAVLYELTWS